MGMMQQSEIAERNGKKLVEQLKDGTFVKDHRSNHGLNFTYGFENLYRARFCSYLGSCACFMMDLRLKERKGEYCG